MRTPLQKWFSSLSVNNRYRSARDPRSRHSIISCRYDVTGQVRGLAMINFNFMHLSIRLLLNSGALLVVAYLVSGFEVDSFWPAAVVAALILGIANAVLKPILVILTLPINILTLGLFTFIINAGLLWLVASFVSGFTIDSFWPTAIIGGVVLWVISWFTNAITKK